MTAVYSTTNPVTCVVDGLGSDSLMPKLYIWQSTYESSAFAYAPATTSSSAVGIGFFAGAGTGSHGLAAVGLNLGDVVMHVSRALYGDGSTSVSTDPYLGRAVTLHAVIGSTPNASTLATSVAWDVTVAQATL